MTYKQAVDRLYEINDRAETLAGKHRLSRADEAEADELDDELALVNAHRKRLERADDLDEGLSQARRHRLLAGHRDG